MQHISPHDASKAHSPGAAEANGSTQLLTLSMLVGKLEKLYQDVTHELTHTLNTAHVPIQAFLQKVADTVAPYIQPPSLK